MNEIFAIIRIIVPYVFLIALFTMLFLELRAIRNVLQARFKVDHMTEERARAYLESIVKPFKDAQ